MRGRGMMDEPITRAEYVRRPFSVCIRVHLWLTLFFASSAFVCFVGFVVESRFIFLPLIFLSSDFSIA